MSTWMMRPWWFYLDEGDGGGTADDKTEEDTTDKKEEAKKDEKKEPGTGDDFEAWLAEQPEDVRSKFEKHEHGLKSALEGERKKAKDYPSMAKRLRELEAKDKERQDAELSEVEKATKQLSEAQEARDKALQELTEERIRNAIHSEASKAVFGDKKQRFVDPDDAYKLIDMAEITIEDGKVVGVAQLLQDLAKRKPHLLEQGGNGSIGTPRGGEKRKGEVEKAKPLSGRF